MSRAQLLVVLAASMMGCRAVLGIEDPLPLEGDAGDGATDGPTDSVAETPADAPTDTGPSDPIAQAEATCARWSSCTQGVGALDIVSCIQRYLDGAADKSGHPLNAASWTCLRAAKSCAAVSDCLGGAVAATACAAVTAGTAKICVGGSVVTCSAASNVGVEPCGLGGRACVGLSPTNAACVASSDCPTASPKCSGTRLVACDGSLDKGADCAKLGGVCSSPASDAGVAGCTGDESTTCDGTSVTCEGSVARYCRFGRPAAIDCALLGSKCDTAARCAPSGADCKDGDAPTCFGENVRYCLGGKLRQIACTSLGLGACKDTFSLKGATVACAP